MSDQSIVLTGGGGKAIFDGIEDFKKIDRGGIGSLSEVVSWLKVG